MEHLEGAALFGSLLPASQDFAPIIREIRQKYKLREVKPGTGWASGIMIS